VLAPENLTNPKQASGYTRVAYRPHRATTKPYQAQGDVVKGQVRYLGPRRATAIEAAQDYCDFINSGAQATPARPRAGHKGKPVDPKVAEAKRLLYEARDDGDSSGYIYCVGEKGAAPSVARVKLGKSKSDPIYRLSSLQTGNPRILYVIASKKVQDRHAAEKRLHEKFAEHCCTNEWFWAADCWDEILAEFGTKVNKGVLLSI
jgi:hypothetical protein